MIAERIAPAVKPLPDLPQAANAIAKNSFAASGKLAGTSNLLCPALARCHTAPLMNDVGVALPPIADDAESAFMWIDDALTITESSKEMTGSTTLRRASIDEFLIALWLEAGRRTTAAAADMINTPKNSAHENPHRQTV